MGEVVSLKLTTTRENSATRMPQRFSASDAKRLLRWAIHMNLSVEQLRYAVETVRDWAETKAHAPLKKDWVRTVQNAIRMGWAMRGCEKYLEASSSGVINPRTGQKIIKRTPITEEYIARYLARLAKGEA